MCVWVCVCVCVTVNEFPLRRRTRLIDNETTMNFQTVLKTEIWETVYLVKILNLCLAHIYAFS